MGDLRSSIPDDEDVLWRGEPSRKLTWGLILGSGVLFGGGALLQLPDLLSIGGAVGTWVATIVLGIYAASFALLAAAVYLGMNRQFAVSSAGVYRRSGLLGASLLSDEKKLVRASVQFAPFEDVAVVAEKRRPVTRGVLVVTEDGRELYLDNLGDSGEVVELIERHVDRDRRRVDRDRQ